MSIKEKIDEIKEEVRGLWALTFSPLSPRDIANLELMKRGSMERVSEPEVKVINAGDPNCKHQLSVTDRFSRKFGEYTAEFTDIYTCSKCDYQYSSKRRSLY